MPSEVIFYPSLRESTSASAAQPITFSNSIAALDISAELRYPCVQRIIGGLFPSREAALLFGDCGETFAAHGRLVLIDNVKFNLEKNA
jgi:hypothetical protein